MGAAQPRHGQLVQRVPPDHLHQRPHLLQAHPPAARPPDLLREPDQVRIPRARPAGVVGVCAAAQPVRARPRWSERVQEGSMMAQRLTRTRPASTETKVDILLVDDDATKRFAMKALLAPLDQNVVEAASGPDALRQLLKQDFAVILLDVRMPGMDGFEAAQLIRQRPRSELTPIIFVTALDRAETDMGRGYDLGAVDFVFAPVVPAIMRARVSVFVELYKAQQELRRYRTQLERLVQ